MSAAGSSGAGRTRRPLCTAPRTRSTARCATRSTPTTSSDHLRGPRARRGDAGYLPLHTGARLSLADRHQPGHHPDSIYLDPFAGGCGPPAAPSTTARSAGSTSPSSDRPAHLPALRTPTSDQRALLPQLRDAARLRGHPRGGADHRGAREGPQGAAAVRPRRPAPSHRRPQTGRRRDDPVDPARQRNPLDAAAHPRLRRPGLPGRRSSRCPGA